MMRSCPSGIAGFRPLILLRIQRSGQTEVLYEKMCIEKIRKNYEKTPSIDCFYR